MMKIKQTIMVFSMVAFMLSCNTRIEPQIGHINDIQVKACMVGELSTKPKSLFKLGDKVVFLVSETNTNREASVRYALDDVAGQYPIFGCEVYNDNGDFIGDVLPQGALFNLIYIIDELGPGETEYYSMAWDAPQVNAQGDTFVNVPLAQGNYVMKCSYTLVGHNRGHQRYDDRNKRTVIQHFPFSIK